VPVPMPPPADEAQPFLLVSIWLDRYDDRAPYETLLGDASDRIAGYLVTESLYTDYGGNRFAGPRTWPDGERSPGVVMVTLLRRPHRMSEADWAREGTHSDSGREAPAIIDREKAASPPARRSISGSW